MKLFSADLKSLQELYVAHLKKALNMELQITEALPLMIQAASDPELENGFTTHLQETKGHITRLEQILRRHTGEVSEEKCKAMSGIITEANDCMKDAGDSAILDISLISGAQEVEHHEMAVYGTLCAWAELLGHDEDVTLLSATLTEEEVTDEKLTILSESINMEAELETVEA